MQFIKRVINGFERLMNRRFQDKKSNFCIQQLSDQGIMKKI